MSRCFPVCGDCDGRGRIWGRGSANEHKASSCPSCVDGAVITDELKRVAVKAWEADVERMFDQAEEYDDPAWLSHRMGRVLAAVVRHLIEKEL